MAKIFLGQVLVLITERKAIDLMRREGRKSRGEGKVASLSVEEGRAAQGRQPPSAAVPILTKTLSQMETEDGWVSLGGVGRRLANVAPDFDPRTYGCSKLSDLVRQSGAFEIDQPEGRSMRIRAKRSSPSRSRRASR